MKVEVLYNVYKLIYVSHSLLSLGGQSPTPSGSRKRTLEMRGDCTPSVPKRRQQYARPATKQLFEGSPLVKVHINITMPSDLIG